MILRKHQCGNNRKLSSDEVREVISLHKLGMTEKELAEHFKVNQGNISKIISKKTYKHLTS